jgi:hypothetical protein
MSKFERKDKSSLARWKDTIYFYNVSKSILRLREKYSLKELSEMTGKSINYICGVQEGYTRPSKDFIEKLEQLEND